MGQPLKSAEEMVKSYVNAVDEMTGESDRGCVILAASLLDDLLTDVVSNFVRARYIPDGGANVDKLLNSLLSDAYAPLGSFHGKTVFCVSVGLLDETTRRGLDVIRKLRNRAAHIAEPFDFDANSIREMFAAVPAKLLELHVALYGQLVPESPNEIRIPIRPFVDWTVLWLSGVLVGVRRDPENARQELSEARHSEVIAGIFKTASEFSQKITRKRTADHD